MASNKFRRGEIWSVDLEPQTHKEEPGKTSHPALIIQSDILNEAGHKTMIVVVGTTNILRDQDYFPFRIALVNQPDLREDTDLLVDQVRAISNKRFLGSKPITILTRNHMKRVEDALKLLTGL